MRSSRTRDMVPVTAAWSLGDPDLDLVVFLGRRHADLMSVQARVPEFAVIRLRAGFDSGSAAEELLSWFIPALEDALAPLGVSVDEFADSPVVLNPSRYTELVVVAGAGAAAKAVAEAVAAKVRSLIEKRRAEKGEDWREPDGYL